MNLWYALSNGDQYRLLSVLSRLHDNMWPLLTKDLSYGYRYKLKKALTHHGIRNNLRVCHRTTSPNRQILSDEKLEMLQEEKYHCMEAQMFGFSSLRESISNMKTEMSNVTRGLTRASNSISDLTESFNNIVNQAIASYREFSTYSSLISLVAKCFAFGYLVAQPHNQSIANLSALTVLLFPASSVGTLVSATGSGLLRAVKGIVAVFADRNRMVTQMEDHINTESFIKSFFHLVKDGIGGTFIGTQPKEFTQFELRAKKLRVIADMIKTTATLWEFLLKALEFILNLFSSYVLSRFGMVPSIVRNDELKKVIDEFNEMYNSGTFDEACHDSMAARRVLDLRTRLKNLECEMCKSLVVRQTAVRIAVLPHISGMIKRLEKVIDTIPPHLKVDAKYARKKPFFLYCYGNPRIGKSAVWQPIIASEIARRLKMREVYEDVSNFSHFRNCGAEFWEGYTGQPIVQYNDLFQDYADTQKMYQAMLELTNVVDDNPFLLNFATLEKKGQMYFTSPVVIANAQDDIIGKPWITGICLSGGKHIYARRNCVVEFTLNFAYANSIRTIDNEKVRLAMADPSKKKVGGDLFPEDMYIINIRNPVTGTILHTLHFEEAIKYVCDQVEEYMQSQDIFKMKIADYARQQWSTQMWNMFSRTEPEVEFHDTTEISMPCKCYEAVNKMYAIEKLDTEQASALYEFYKGAHTCIESELSWDYTDLSFVTKYMEETRQELSRVPWYNYLLVGIGVVGMICLGFKLYKSFTKTSNYQQTAEGTMQPGKRRPKRVPIPPKKVMDQETQGYGVGIS